MGSAEPCSGLYTYGCEMANQLSEAPSRCDPPRADDSSQHGFPDPCPSMPARGSCGRDKGALVIGAQAMFSSSPSPCSVDINECFLVPHLGRKALSHP